MKRMLWASCVLAAFFFVSQDCHARRWEVSLLAGYTMGGSFDAEDGNGSDTGTTLDIKESPSFAVALDTDYEKGTEFEIYYSRQATELKADNGPFSGGSLFDLDIHYLQIGGTVILTRVKDVFGETLFEPNSFCEPYFAGSIGVAHMRPRDSAYDPVTRLAGSLGFGARLHVTDRLGLRMEARGFAIFFNGSGAAFGGPEGVRIFASSDVLGQGVLNAGLYYDF